LIWAFLIFFATLAIDLYTDIRLFYRRRPVKHVRGAILRLLGLIPACLFGGWVFVPFAFFGYWSLFDTLWGLFTSRKWPFIGSTSKLDRLQRKYPALLWFKYLGFIASIVILIYETHRKF
jgi:hypothetical protein